MVWSRLGQQHGSGAAAWSRGVAVVDAPRFALVAFRGMDSKGDIDAFHARALELGATDEGAPGQRGDTFYAAYVRDPDGHKICAYNAEWLA